MLTRRTFLSRSMTLAVAAVIPSSVFSGQGSKKLKNIGFISGIIDNELEKDWKGALKQAASFGYTEFETGGYLGNSPEGFLSFCNEIRLRPVACGIDFNGTDDKLMQDIGLLHKLKIDIAVTYWPWYTGGPFRLEDCRKSAERLNYLGKKCRDNGIIFCWHNHNREFAEMEKGLPFDFLMHNTDPDAVKCELDIYWVKKGGGDPLSMLKKYSGRYTILHVKDMAPGPAMDFECPGSGIIDFVPLFREADNQGIKHFMVERDNVPDGMACLKSSADYLKRISY